MRRPPPLLSILGASAVTLAALTGMSDCTGPKNSAGRSHSQKPKHATAQLEFGNTINYGAFGTNTQVNCDDGKSLNVGGSNNTLTVRGHCESVNILGADNRLVADYAEVSAVPQAVRRAAAMTTPSFAIGTPPAGAMNVLPVLTEIAGRAASHVEGAANHVISLSLLPMSPDDLVFLAETLGTGPVRLVSRGYGTCAVQATARALSRRKSG